MHGRDLCELFPRETGFTMHRYLNRLRLLIALESLDTWFHVDTRFGAGDGPMVRGCQPRVQRYADVAIVTYFSRGSYGPEGEERAAYLKETNVLVKREGGWKVVHIHVSATS